MMIGQIEIEDQFDSDNEVCVSFPNRSAVWLNESELYELHAHLERLLIEAQSPTRPEQGAPTRNDNCAL